MNPKTMRRIAIPPGILLAALLALAPSAAPAQGFFDRLILRPVTITQPGTYVVGRSFDAMGSAPAIEIRSDNVDLDLSGQTLRGTGSLQGVGVLIDGVRNVEVRNGGLDRFGIGVRVVGSRNVTLSGLRVAAQDSGGSPPNVEVGVMIVNSRGVTLRKTTIVDTFLGVFVRGGGSGGNRIESNTLTGGANGALGICYNPAPGEGDPGPQGDLVSDNLISRWSTGIAASVGSVGNIFRGNAIGYFDQSFTEAAPGTNLFEDNSSIEIDP